MNKAIHLLKLVGIYIIMTKSALATSESSYLPDPNLSQIKRSDIVVLSGCSGGGKSSILEELNRRGYPTIPEPGREIVKEQLAIEGQSLPWSNLDMFLELALSRYLHHFNQANVSSSYTFADRSIMDALKLDHSQGKHFVNAAQKFRYHPVVFLVPPWKEIYKQDQERKHSFDEATKEFYELVEKYKRFSYETIFIPKGTVKNRADFIIKKLNDKSGVKQQSFREKIEIIEQRSKGRLGFWAYHINKKVTLSHRPEERFPMGSTFKPFLCSMILHQQSANPEILGEFMIPRNSDLTTYAPIVSKHIDKKISIADLCKATISTSDNVAANILLSKFGGPNSLNQFMKKIGDSKFRLDRIEPDLNTAIPGDARDTSTPKAMGESLRELTYGTTLPRSLQNTLLSWLKASQTGKKRIHAGVPRGWAVGDKTGTSAYGTTNDIGIIWSPEGAIVIAIFFTQKSIDDLPQDKTIAETTKLILTELTSSKTT